MPHWNEFKCVRALHILSPVQYHGENGTSLERVLPNSHEILYGFARNLVRMALQSWFFMTHFRLPCVYSGTSIAKIFYTNDITKSKNNILHYNKTQIYVSSICSYSYTPYSNSEEQQKRAPNISESVWIPRITLISEVWRLDFPCLY
jgi:hypothetical protein